MSEFLDDQTLFAEEEPLLEHRRKKRSLEVVKARKISPIVLLGGAGVFFFIMVGSTLFMMSGKRGPGVVPITPTPTPIQQTVTDLDQLFLELRTSVDKADPTANSMTFPPVASEITVGNN